MATPAATLGDLGYEHTMGTEGTAKPKKRKKRGEGLAAAGMGAGLAAAEMAAAGVSGGCKEGGALLTLQDMNKMHGQSPLEVNAKISVQAKPYNAEQIGAGREVGAGKCCAGASGGARKKKTV